MVEPAPVSVLCVDDNHFVASAVATKLRMAGGFEWMGHLESADDLADLASKREPAVILLDVDMPGRNPFDVLRALTEGGCRSRVIVFSGHVRRELLDRAIDAGAWGYVSKSDGEEALLDGIRRVASSEFVMSAEVRAVCEQG